MRRLAALLLLAACGTDADTPPPNPPPPPPPDEPPAGMVRVAAGAFRMGCDDPDPGCGVDEKPARTITLSRFDIDKIEVTHAAYQACVAATGCSSPASGFEPASEFPLRHVTWHQAVAYCAWRGRRLPTEAEWEKAARGADGRLYPWGDDAPTCERANFSDCGLSGPRLAGGAPGPYGALDMIGNLAEWTQDWFAAYEAGDATDPTGPATGAYKAVRGKGFSDNPQFLLAYERSSKRAPDDETFFVGFRCAKSAP